MRDAQDADVLAGAPAPAGPDSSEPGPNPLRVSLPVAAVVVAVDQLTKRLALNGLSPGSCDQPDACIDLVAGVRLHLVFNTGAAFTTGSGLGPLLAVLAFIMAGVLLVMSTRRSDRLGIALFGAIAGGAVGNLVDRVFRAEDGPLSGAVVDFIDLGWWPVFNIADSAIVVGVAAIIGLTLIEDRARSEDRAPSD